MPEQAIELKAPLLLEREKYPGCGWETKILNASGEIVYRDGFEYLDIAPILFSDNELRRIVACLNTLDGVETETLEYGHLKLAVQDWVEARRKACRKPSN